MTTCLRPVFGRFIAVFIVTGALDVGFAQTVGATRGQLTIRVADSTGATVADAVVILTRGAERRTMTTGDDGMVPFANLAPGEWTVTVTRDGFARWQQVVSVTSGTIDVPVGLAVAGFSETVQVESDIDAPTQIPLNAPATGGSRLDIPVRDLPASLYLVNQELIQERGARSVAEAVQLAVGMQATTNVGSIPAYATRGWDDNSVSIMRDGIRQNSRSQSSRPLDSFILERVEILKGPASLLYGEGAIGGAVNMVSKSPMSQMGADTLLSYGSFGEYRVGVGVNVPLRRNLFARVDVSQTGSDGYVGHSPQKLLAGLASVRWLPTSNISLKASGTYTYDNTSAYYATPFINDGFDRRTLDFNYNMEDRLTKSHNRWGQLEADVLASGGWKLHNHFFAATHTLDWRNFEGYAYNAALNTVDVTSYFLIWRDDLLLGERFDARNTFVVAGRTLNVTVGGELQRNDMERAGNPVPNTPAYTITRRLDPLNPQPHFDPGLPYVRQRDVLVTTKGVFAESALDVTARLKLVTGLRWEEIGLDYTPFPSLVTASKDYNPTTGRLGAVFQITPSANVYASYSRAVEPTVQLVSLDGSQQQFSLVPARQLEIGAKGGAFEGRLDGTFAYFDIQKRDILITALIDGIRTNQQVGQQTSRGIELTLVGRPSASLTIAGDIAVAGANFDDFMEIVNNMNLSRTGNTPRNVPRVIWNISPIQRIGRFDITGTVRQVGKRWGDNANTRLVSAYTTAEAAVGYSVRNGSRLRLRVRNLTDSVYTQQATSNTAARLEAPRSIDLTFTTDFAGF